MIVMATAMMRVLTTTVIMSLATGNVARSLSELMPNVLFVLGVCLHSKEKIAKLKEQQ